MNKKPADYKQFDARWRGKVYSAVGDARQTMKTSGCGPSACADVISTFCDKSITPWQVAQEFMEKGFRTRKSGTAYGAFKWAFQKYKGKGLSRFAQGRKCHAAVKAALAEGALAVALMGPGYWTRGGHYIVVWKWEGGVVYACDPGSSVRKRQAEDAFKKQARRYFVFWP